MKIVNYQRNEDGRLAAYAWPGGYPLIYITTDGGVLCPGCANRDNGSQARTEDGPDDDPRDGWKIEGADIHYEGDPEICCHCGKEIPSAYGA